MPEPATEKLRHGYVPMVEVWRGDTIESVHHGAIVVADADGRPVAAAGDPATATFLRSSAKPAQVLPLLESGAMERFGFEDREIAVMIGSHGGEPFHVEAVRSILAKIGLREDALQCGTHPPYHRPTARALAAAGAAPTALHNNCSGKHAGMLALAVHLAAPTGAYLEPAHPVQARIRARIEGLSGMPAGGARTAVDGCSAPTFAMPLLSAARLYARLVEAAAGTPAGARRGAAEPWVAAARRALGAMRRHPEMVAGTDRLCTALLQAAEAYALVAKIGAEGFYGMGFVRDGRALGLALKIADGEGERARHAAALEALRRLGVLGAEEAERLRARFVPEVKSRRGAVVGRVATVFDLRPPAG